MPLEKGIPDVDAETVFLRTKTLGDVEVMLRVGGGVTEHRKPTGEGENAKNKKKGGPKPPRVTDIEDLYD